MTRTLAWFALPLTFALAGCATPQTTQPRANNDMSGITGYYEQATAPHHRAVRKPQRDEQALALRMLAKKADALLAKTQSPDGDVRLAAHTDAESSAVGAAYRTALIDLRTAATKSDLPAVRKSYARLLSACRHLPVSANQP